jgi:hypothetical protein
MRAVSTEAWMEDVDPPNQKKKKKERKKRRERELMIGDKSHRVVGKHYCKCSSGLADKIEIKNQLPRPPSRREACA